VVVVDEVCDRSEQALRGALSPVATDLGDGDRVVHNEQRSRLGKREHQQRVFDDPVIAVVSVDERDREGLRLATVFNLAVRLEQADPDGDRLLYERAAAMGDRDAMANLGTLLMGTDPAGARWRGGLN
jgi:hypothetical protein